ncbi:hypothetical protein ABE322_30105 [Priestia megaterium]
MTHEFIRRELKRLTIGIQDLKQALEQVKTENSLASTTKSVKEYNEWLLERFKTNISYYEKRKRYLNLRLGQPEEEPPASFINAPHVYLEA